jgi:ribosomal protein S18 acetylase RimI-like enzyme
VIEPVSIRAATHADVEAVLRLWRVPDVHPSSTDSAAAVGRMIDHPTCALLLAERDREPVGTLIAAWDGWRGGLYRLMVVPEMRRRGIAIALVRTAETFLEGVGCSRISVHVLGDDAPAVAFWVAAGYDADDRMRRFLRNVPVEPNLGTGRPGR